MTERELRPECRPRPLDPFDPAAVRRIAVVRALQLGDMLVAVPALRALRAGFPSAEIALIGLTWAGEFARRFAHLVDRFVPFAGYPGIAEAPDEPEWTRRWVEARRAERYDLVVQLHGSGGASNPLALDLGGRWTVGHYEDEPPPALALGRPYPSTEPEVTRNLGLVELLGCRPRGVDLEFPLFPEDHAEGRALLRPLQWSGRPWIGLHAGSRAPARRWEPARYAGVADRLAHLHGAQLVLTGGPDEADAVHEVERRMTARPLNLAGRTSLGGLAAVLAELDLFVGNDTGPGHLAEAVGTPTVRLFGPADHRRWASLDPARHRVVRVDVPCSPCGHAVCPIDHRCLRLIEPESVVLAAERLLSSEARACHA